MAETFEIHSKDVTNSGRQPYVVHVGASSTHADDLVQSAEARSSIDEAREFLEHTLGDGELSGSELNAAAKAAGVGEYALREAKRRYTRRRRPGGTTGPWVLSLLPTTVSTESTTSTYLSNLPSENQTKEIV